MDKNTMENPLTLLALLLPLAPPASPLAGPRDTHHVVNPGFEDNTEGKAKGGSRPGVSFTSDPTESSTLRFPGQNLMQEQLADAYQRRSSVTLCEREELPGCYLRAL